MPNNMTRKNRSNRSNRGFLGRLYAPVNRGLQAVGEIGRETTSTVGNVFGRTLSGVRRVGTTATGRLNQGVGELVSGRSRKNRKGGRRSRKDRGNRKNRSRKNRGNRKNRSNRR